MQTSSRCVCIGVDKACQSTASLTGSEGVSVLTFYLPEFALAAGVEGSEEQLVASPVTPTSPIPDTPPRRVRFLFLRCCKCVCFRISTRVCVCVGGHSPSVCHAGLQGSFPFALDKHFLSVNTGEPGTPQLPDVHTCVHTHTHTHTDTHTHSTHTHMNR